MRRFGSQARGRELMRAAARKLPARPRPKAKPKRKRPVPRNASRRVRSPQPPRAVEIYFAQALRRVAARFARAIRKHLTPAAIARFAKPAKPAVVEKTDALRADAGEEDVDEDDDLDDDEIEALEDELEELIDAVRDSAEEAADDTEDVTRASRETGKRALKHSKNEFSRLGIKVRKEPETNALLSGWTKDTVARIQGFQGDQMDKIEEILRGGYGRRAESLAEDIEERIAGITERRAEFIARDSVLTLNGRITAERQTAAGIEKYIWTTSSDERVRDSHEALEGETFSWESGGDPEEGHPGEAPLCRCTAFPILPELEDDDEDDDDEVFH